MRTRINCLTSFTLLWTVFFSSATGLNDATRNQGEKQVRRRVQKQTANLQYEHNFEIIVVECFSSHVMADVEGRGKVAMKNIQVGDKVLTGSGTYKTIYSIDHRHPTKSASFIQIQTELDYDPIEMTQLHMIFLEGITNPVPASSVKVGDRLRTIEGPVTVTKIDTITREGVFSPLTVDGTIVVNGIIASSYSSISTDTEWVEMFGIKILPSQSLLHRLLKPYRFMCMEVSLDLCKSSSERVLYSRFGHKIFTSWLEQSQMLQALSLSIFLILVHSLDFIINPYGIILGASLSWLYLRQLRISSSRKNIKKMKESKI